MKKTYSCNFIVSGCDVKLIFNSIKYDGFYALALGEDHLDTEFGKHLHGKEATVVNVRIGAHTEYDVMINGHLWERMPAEVFDLYGEEDTDND